MSAKYGGAVKIAISGKGGVGKTTLSGVLSRIYAEEGRKVLAVDADPDANLASSLGFRAEEVSAIKPISQMKELIEERTGTRAGMMGTMFKINPTVDDIPDKYNVEKNGIKLLMMGTVKKGGTGCYCPENVMLKSLLTHMLVERDEVVIVDMEAGIEHLGRGTAYGMDALIVVVEPGQRSIQTAQNVKKLASDIDIKNIFIVGNKISSKQDEEFIKSSLDEMEVIGFISYNSDVINSDLEGVSPFDRSRKVVEEVKKIKQRLEEKLKTV
jgi:CO dehydrogenase maturation factor